VQWHSACGIHDVDNRIETGSGLRTITATRHRNNQAIGGLVCKYGMTTGGTCGEIDYKTYAPSWVTSAASTFIYVDGDGLGVNLSEGGDSGVDCLARRRSRHGAVRSGVPEFGVARR